MKKQILAISLLSAISSTSLIGPAHAKRVGPPVVHPVIHQDLRIETLREKTKSEIRIFVVAHPTQSTSSPPRWKTELYRITLDPTLESDVQEIAIRSVTVKKQTLTITDERGRVFHLDVSTGKNLTVTPPKKLR